MPFHQKKKIHFDYDFSRIAQWVPRLQYLCLTIGTCCHKDMETFTDNVDSKDNISQLEVPAVLELALMIH